MIDILDQYYSPTIFRRHDRSPEPEKVVKTCAPKCNEPLIDLTSFSYQIWRSILHVRHSAICESDQEPNPESQNDGIVYETTLEVLLLHPVPRHTPGPLVLLVSKELRFAYLIDTLEERLPNQRDFPTRQSAISFNPLMSDQICSTAIGHIIRTRQRRLSLWHSLLGCTCR